MNNIWEVIGSVSSLGCFIVGIVALIVSIITLKKVNSINSKINTIVKGNNNTITTNSADGNSNSESYQAGRNIKR